MKHKFHTVHAVSVFMGM